MAKKYQDIFEVITLSSHGKPNASLEFNYLAKMKVDEYQYVATSIWESILNNFTIKNNLVDVYLKNKFIRQYTLAELYVQMLVLKSFVEYNCPIHENDLFVVPNMTPKDIYGPIEDLLNKLKNHFEVNNIDFDLLANVAAEIMESFNLLSIIFSWISPTSLSLYDIIQFAKRNPEFNELINSRLNPEANIKENEIIIQDIERRLVKVIKEDKENCLNQYVTTGRVKIPQLRQLFGVVGPRSDITKTIFPLAISGNFLHGLENAAELFMEAVTARSALIDKDKNVADSGYEARKIDLNTLNTDINHDVEDCKTRYVLNFPVNTKFELDMLHNKYEVMENGELRAIDSSKDKHLIGKTVKVRSHVYCALPEGQVCRTCYGANAKLIKGTRIGYFPSIKIQHGASNKIISSKHYQGTNASDISDKGIMKWFHIDENACYLKPEKNYNDIKLVIDKLYIENLMENDSSDDSEYETTTLENIYIVATHKDKKTGEPIEERYYFNDLNNIYLQLNTDILDEKSAIKMDPTSDEAEILLGKLDPFTPILSLIIVSEGVVYYLKEFIKTIDSKKIQEFNSPDEVIYAISQIMDKLDFTVRLQHIETMVYNCVKDPLSNLTKRPDFRKAGVQLVMAPINGSIMRKDPLTSMSFEKYIDQLKKVLFFKNPNQSGIFDPFFQTNIDIMPKR